MPPENPLTKNSNTSLSDTFLSKDIIRLYKEQLGIDVSPVFAGKEKIYLYKDEETGYRFYYPEGIDGDGKFYEDLQNKLGEDYYHIWKFENQMAFDVINHNDKVLDIGCGIGNFLVRAKEKANDVVGLELNEHAVNVCREKGLTVFNEMIQEHAKTHENFYNVVCMFQVLEHIYNVKDFLEASLKVLKSGGKLIIGVPNNEPYFLGYDKYCTLNLPPHHMGLWNKKTFKALAKLYDLKIIETKYDIDGRIIAEAYTRSKYMANIKSLPGKHSLSEKFRLLLFGLITTPLTVIKKITKGLHGSHIALVFEKK